jgi:outer membrane lipoprotein-sorting protein
MDPLGQQGTQEHTIYDLEINPVIEDALFVMKLPEGYERIDDFEPAAPVASGH